MVANRSPAEAETLGVDPFREGDLVTEAPRGTIARTVEQMPTQEEFLAQNRGAIDPAMRMSA